MKRKYIKLNDNYSHLSLGNIISAIKEESKNKTSAIQSEVFCALFNLDYINESTVNNYCIGSRSIGNDYKQIYINLKNQYLKNNDIFISIIDNILSIINGSLYDIKNINTINENTSLQNICKKLYNISKNDFNIPKNITTNFRKLLTNQKYYNLFVEILLYAILEKKQPLYEDEKTKNVIETILENTDISVNDLQNFLLLELNEGINFSHSLKKLANENNAYANYHLGVLEYTGEYAGYKRYDQAFEYFSKAAKNNHPSAYWMMGDLIIKNKIGNKDYDKAFEYFKKAQELGSIAAINSLGICYKEGLGVAKDINIALKYFELAAAKNYAYAFNNLGYYYEQNHDFDKALEYYLKSANLLESYACNKVGEFKRKNNQKKDALYYYKKSIGSSINEICTWSYYNIAKYYFLEGDLESNTLKNIPKAIEYFEKAQDLIESLQELLFIYIQKYLDTLEDIYLNKIYHYKKLIEQHPKYNNQYKNIIENKIDSLKSKEPISINIY